MVSARCSVLLEREEVAVGESRAPFRFVLVGMVNTCVALAVIYTAKWLLGASDVVANASGYVVGLLVSFKLNSAWTFSHDGPIGRTLTRFLAVQGVAYCLNLLCVISLIELGVDSYLAQAMGIPPYAIVSYLGSRYVAFVPTRKMVSDKHFQ